MLHLPRVFIAFFALVLASCATIPPEAPELSGQLGIRISAIESAHTRLVEQFFAEKRRRVDDFVQEVWVPTFAAEFFGDPKVDDIWKEVVASKDPNDRLKFIVLVGPRLQTKINLKRLELIKPLEDLERQVKLKLKSDYDQARSINNTLTAFLQSASKVEENRKRYLDLVGVNQNQVDKFINKTDDAVSELLGKATDVQNRVKNAEDFVDKIKKITDQIES